MKEFISIVLGVLLLAVKVVISLVAMFVFVLIGLSIYMIFLKMPDYKLIFLLVSFFIFCLMSIKVLNAIFFEPESRLFSFIVYLIVIILLITSIAIYGKEFSKIRFYNKVPENVMMREKRDTFKYDQDIYINIDSGFNNKFDYDENYREDIMLKVKYYPDFIKDINVQKVNNNVNVVVDGLKPDFHQILKHYLRCYNRKQIFDYKYLYDVNISFEGSPEALNEIRKSIRNWHFYTHITC